MKIIIFIGGWARVRKTYNKLLKSCLDDFKIIIVPYSDLVADQADFGLGEGLLRFLDERRLSKVYLAGHSLGEKYAYVLRVSTPTGLKLFSLSTHAGLWRALHFFAY